jgi:ClpX C4-type zinc finger
MPHQPAGRWRRARGKAAGLACSFCGKPRTGALRPVAGPVVYISGERIGLCAETLAEPEPGQSAARLEDVPRDGLGDGRSARSPVGPAVYPLPANRGRECPDKIEWICRIVDADIGLHVCGRHPAFEQS